MDDLGAQPAASTNAAVVTRFIDEVINGGNLDLIDALWHEDLVWEGGSLGERHGIEAYKKMMGATGGGSRWANLHLTVHNIFAQDDTVVVQFTNSGYRTGRLLGVVPFRSKRGSWNGVGIYTLRGGKIVHAWFVEDVVAMLRSLGGPGALDLITSSGK
ncbi:nuclear transport factor 2 family protein [Micromonospora sp. WMMD812]|uniref:ester cyclase n=1 Tax=Micromonospora sp. WMMD812 TaxID=3015152 RepID=UPI00248C8FD5|nr:nuclear transport factor 2 family protein [Micromonospora sp. WMMD812]WBB69061.1 ester cyclase [Micromonospora sp. WMMD812]